MANEVTARFALQLRSGNFIPPPYSIGFSADLVGKFGPTPGAIEVATTGTDVDLSQLTTPGWAWFYNPDAINYVKWGVWDPEQGKFYPVGEIPAGKGYPFYFSREFFWEFGTGSGTIGGPTNRLRFYAMGAPVQVFVGVHER